MPIKRLRRGTHERLTKRARVLACTDSDNQVCCFCDIPGSRRACQGTLLGPFTVRRQFGRGKKYIDVYAHRNCAIWAPEVWEYEDPETNRVVVMGVESAYKRSRRSKCMVCKKTGASLACLLKGKACCRNLHFRCALIAGAVLLPWTAYTILCPIHKDLTITGDAQAYPDRMRHAQTPVPPHLLDDETSLCCQGCEEDNYRLESGALLVCGNCNAAYHARCLEPPILRDGIAAVKSSQGHFRCEGCTECSKCHVALDVLSLGSASCKMCDQRGFKSCRCGAEGDHLTCVLCRISFHKSCLGVSVKSGDPFRCVTCRICSHCDQLDILKWDESIAACGVCSARHAEGHFCPGCNKVYPEEDSEPMVWCNFCSQWFHGQCAGLDDIAFSVLENSDEEWSCPSCTDKNDSRKSRRKRIARKIDRAEKASPNDEVKATNRPVRGKRRRGRPRKNGFVMDQRILEEEFSDEVTSYCGSETKECSSKPLSDMSTPEICDLTLEEPSGSDDHTFEDEGSSIPTGQEIIFVPLDGMREVAGAPVASKVDLCILCGSGGPPSSLRFCFVCGEAYHGYCLSPPLPMRESYPRTNSLGTLHRLNSGGCGMDSFPWSCWRCKHCEICKSTASTPSILICDHCDRGFNPLCLNPPILDVPSGAFTCAECSICELCGCIASPPSPVQDHIFCNTCAPVVQGAPPCSICHTKYPSFPPMNQVSDPRIFQKAILARECSACHSIIHLDCDSSVSHTTKNAYVCISCYGEPVRMSEVSDQDLPVTRNSATPEEDTLTTSLTYKVHHDPITTSNGSLEALKSREPNGIATIDCCQMGSDYRRCHLCSGKEGTSNGQRLLPWNDQMSVNGDVWIHASCAFWSNDFSLSKRKKGLLCVNRRQLSQRMKKRTCSSCGLRRATLTCAVSGCAANYHFPCAVKQSCRFVTNTKIGIVKHSSSLIPLSDVKDVFMLCPNHVRMQHSGDDFCERALEASDEVDFAYPLRLYVVPISERKVLSPQAGVRVGALTALKIGKLMPRTNAFVVENALIPSGYIASRRYWSFRNPSQRTEYRFTIDGDDISGPIWSITVADDPVFKVERSTCVEAWLEVQRRLAWKGPTMSASEAFGAASVRGVISLIEKLPYAQLFGERYKFWYVFPSTPIEVKPIPQPYENYTGSARTEGYIPRRILFREAQMKADPLPPTYDNAPTGQMFQYQVAVEQAEAQMIGSSTTASKEVGQFSRRSSLVPLRRSPGTIMSNLPYATQYRHMRKMWRLNTRVLRSSIEGWGVFAAQNIGPDEMVVEYAGELIRPSVSDLREAQYEEKGMGCYLFRIQRSPHIVDATMKGSNARFINHSCDPNCVSKTILIEPGRRVIVIYSKRWIARGEELTYDYLFEFEEGEDRQPCRCGAANCRRWMN